MAPTSRPPANRFVAKICAPIDHLVSVGKYSRCQRPEREAVSLDYIAMFPLCSHCRRGADGRPREEVIRTPMILRR
jgi:hypothetical protein